MLPKPGLWAYASGFGLLALAVVWIAGKSRYEES